MSLAGGYALACAARLPARVTAVGVIASPAVTSEHGAAWHRDRLTPTQGAFFATSSDLTFRSAGRDE